PIGLSVRLIGWFIGYPDGSVIGSSGWFIIIRCLKRKRADIWSIRSDPINPMAHHRLKKDRIEVNPINPVNSIWSDRSDGSSPAIRGYPRLELSEPDGVVT